MYLSLPIFDVGEYMPTKKRKRYILLEMVSSYSSRTENYIRHICSQETTQLNDEIRVLPGVKWIFLSERFDEFLVL